jgi:hypothetical protein
MLFDVGNKVIRLTSKFARLLAVRVTILIFIGILIAPSAMRANCQLGSESASRLDAGFESLYDLNFDAAQSQFSDWKARYPEDPSAQQPPPALTYFRNSIGSEFCRANSFATTKPFSGARN